MRRERKKELGGKKDILHAKNIRIILLTVPSKFGIDRHACTQMVSQNLYVKKHTFQASRERAMKRHRYSI